MQLSNLHHATCITLLALLGPPTCNMDYKKFIKPELALTPPNLHTDNSICFLLQLMAKISYKQEHHLLQSDTPITFEGILYDFIEGV